MKKKRTYNTRLIRKTQSYSVQDVAELYQTHKNTVLHWIKDGLPIIDKRKPYLIYGAELATYLDKKQAGRKQKCRPDEFYCCKCRKPRKASQNIVTVEIRNDTKLCLRGVCSICATGLCRFGSLVKLPEYRKTFSIETVQDRRITGCSEPAVNCEMRKEENHGEVQSEKRAHQA